ncbi:MAG TPA: Hsp20/alpha crystallin family protein [Burkholderiaceae bacterium]|nr:Hsp20/alpha crystallin family protein [Burkholderiaceae bacterium]
MFLVPLNRRADWLRHFDRLIGAPLDDLFTRDAQASLPRTPALDVAETDQAYTVTLDLPGVAKDNVKVSIEGRRVQIEAQAQQTQERKDGDRVLVRERSASSYARSFVLPAEIDQERSSAKLDNGVLKLELAKRAEASVKRIAIN